MLVHPLDGLRGTDLCAGRMSSAEVAEDDLRFVLVKEDGMVRANFHTLAAKGALLPVKGDGMGLLIFRQSLRGAALDAIRVSTMNANDQRVLSLGLILDHPDGRFLIIEFLEMEEGTGQLTGAAACAFFLIYDQKVRNRISFKWLLAQSGNGEIEKAEGAVPLRFGRLEDPGMAFAEGAPAVIADPGDLFLASCRTTT